MLAMALNSLVVSPKWALFLLSCTPTQTDVYAVPLFGKDCAVQHTCPSQGKRSGQPTPPPNCLHDSSSLFFHVLKLNRIGSAPWFRLKKYHRCEQFTQTLFVPLEHRKVWAGRSAAVTSPGSQTRTVRLGGKGEGPVPTTDCYGILTTRLFLVLFTP